MMRRWGSAIEALDRKIRVSGGEEKSLFASRLIYIKTTL